MTGLLFMFFDILRKNEHSSAITTDNAPELIYHERLDHGVSKEIIIKASWCNLLEDLSPSGFDHEGGL